IVTSLVNIKTSGRVIFLAPPEVFGTNLQKYFQKYPGAKQTSEGLVVPRKDGTTTHISNGYFEESYAIDGEKAMLEYSHTSKIHLLQTTDDEVIGKTNYSSLRDNLNIEITSVNENHNFTKNRQNLFTYL